MAAKRSEPESIPLASRPIQAVYKDGLVIRAHWIERDGATICVGMEVWKDVQPQPDGTSVTPLPGGKVRGIGTMDLRSIPVAKVLDDLWQQQRSAETAYNAALDRFEGDIDTEPLKTELYEKPRRVNPSDRAFFQQVANVYQEAMRSPSGRKKPTDAVARHFGDASSSAATKWVRRARELGFLPPTTPGKPSAVPTVKKARRAK